jgi:RND family efflux transporter MFP subunit
MKKKIFNSGKSLILAIISISIITACSSGEKQKSLSMEEIQKQEGIPVKTEIIKPRLFTKHLRFVGKFKGIRQTTVGAMIGGRIEKIHAKPGEKVRKDQVIIEFPEDAPASQIQQAKAAYEVAEKTYKRLKALFEAGQVSQAKLDGAEAQYLVNKRNYEVMRQMLKLDAPYDGTVTEIMVHEGDNVKAKTPLFTVAQLNKMKIRIWLSDNERMQIHKGMKAIATAGGKSFVGKVSEISVAIDPMKQAFYADLIFDNSKGEILPGLTANVEIVIYENPRAIVVPRNLVLSEDSKHFVFITRDSKAIKKFVTIANSNGTYYEIASGLNVGDSIVTQGILRLRNGAKVKVVN